MSAEDFNSAAEVGKTRSVMNSFLGEIITQIIGNDHVQKLFEGQAVPADMAGKSTGEIALKLGVISANTKTALLVAQAAERTLRVVEQMDSGVYTYVPAEDPVFKFVGFERDPDTMKAAQATWMAAQMCMNIPGKSAVSGQAPEGKDILAGFDRDAFKTAAAHYYTVSAGILKQEGFDEAAQKMSGVAKHISLGIKGISIGTPQQTIDFMSGYADTSGQEVFKKLIGLMSLKTPPAASAPSAPTP